MSSAKYEISIHWSPFHDNEFILAGNSILFYSIFNFDSSNVAFMFFSKLFFE